MLRILGMPDEARQLNLEGGIATPDSSIDEAKAAAKESSLGSANALSDGNSGPTAALGRISSESPPPGRTRTVGNGRE